jgi:hypothetical protein
MNFSLKKPPPNPNGNPNFRKQWDNLGETHPVKLPRELHSIFKDLATAINSGKIATTDLIAITGKPSLTIVPSPENSNTELIEKLEQFEEFQRQSWGKFANQKGEFTTNSPCWTKYNEFKAWLADQGE